jgi:tetratricopeptide (TPR) repeat protein
VTVSERAPVQPLVTPAKALHADERVPLRLTVTRGVLGMELYESIDLGPVEVRTLSASLPGLKFPLDLSGGVPLFRHRRGDLERVELTLSLDALGRWLAPKLDGNVVGKLWKPPLAWTIPSGIAIGLSGDKGALAFELCWAPTHSDVRFVLLRARGAGLEAPALGYALRAVDTALTGLGEREGRILTISRSAHRLARAILPAVGARVPETNRVRFGSFEVDGDRAHVELDATFDPPPLHANAARALELAELCKSSDDALAQGDLDAARAGYLDALERAPRHPEIARLMAEIDVCVPHRAEAALGMLVETLPATQAGWAGAELLARVGDLEGAREASRELARDEPYAPLAALSWSRLGELETTAPARLAAFDRAVAAAPGLEPVRVRRFQERVALGDVDAALADAEHLEAIAVGALARHEALMRSARALFTRGFARDAGRLFERALRYLPDDAAATAGLARALIEAKKGDRAFALLQRAIRLSEQAGKVDPDALVDMARLLASELRDLPQAIARIREVPSSSPRAVEARALEAEWRKSIGDIVGASLAFARLRDLLETIEPKPDRAVDYLLEAARFEREIQRDAHSAERHLAVALRLAPRDRAVGDAYREVAALVAARGSRLREPVSDRIPAPAVEEDTRDTTVPPPQPIEDELGDLEAGIAPRPNPLDLMELEQLENKLREDPDNVDISLKLADVLSRLGRHHEIHVLLSSRLDDAPPEDRPMIVPRLRVALTRLVELARAAGRPDEATLYAGALERLGSASRA